MENYHLEEVVIVGGGIAGLSCLNALLDRGVSALLLEGGQIGSAKMCGEFLAPDASEVLQKWQIGPTQAISRIAFYSAKQSLHLTLPVEAVAFSRSEAEFQLAARATALGGRIRENARIQNIQPKTAFAPYVFTLETGEQIHTAKAFFATGRFKALRARPLLLPYVGVKFHIPRVIEPSRLLMHSLPDAYFGIVPISAQLSNCAGLMRASTVLKAGSSQQYLEHVCLANKTLKAHLEDVDLKNIQVLEAPAPEFGLKTNPLWPDAYWIGDAFAGLHPAIGSGFAFAVNSASLAAQCYLCNDPATYHRTILSQSKLKLRIGEILHRVLMSPRVANSLMLVAKSWPSGLHYLLKRLDYL
jgi:flavin-dependent dehydrogenase